MIITDKFVFIHYNKTGGTFVRRTMVEWGRRNNIPVESITQRKHRPVREIPPGNEHKRIIATIRNPYRIYVSDWRYRYWVRQRLHSSWLLENREYEFSEWMEAIHDYPSRRNIPAILWDAAKLRNLGYLTLDFAYVYAIDPLYALRDQGYFCYCLDSVHWLHTETLNADLIDLLRTYYPGSETDFIADLPPVYPQNVGGESEDWQAHYTPELTELVRRRDAWLFDYFEEYQ